MRSLAFVCPLSNDLCSVNRRKSWCRLRLLPTPKDRRHGKLRQSKGRELIPSSSSRKHKQRHAQHLRRSTMMEDGDVPSDTAPTASESGKQQQAKQRKRGWPVDDDGDSAHTHRRSPGRRSSRKASTAPNPSYSNSSFEGSQSELNRLMKRNDAHSYRMRQSIILSAVLASKKGTVDSDPTFLGGDGRVYPNLRLAFGQHVDMKQCSLCKQRVQGSWYCRVAHAHLDKPDFDGGTSAEELVELFQCSVDVIEKRAWSLIHGKDEEEGKQEEKKKKRSMNYDEEFSMNLLNEDILYQITSFLPSLKDLTSFCKTSKRCQQLMHGSIRSEKLLRGVFFRAFGMQGTRGKFESNLTWKERWVMIRSLRRGLLDKKCILMPDTKSSHHQLKSTIDVLTHREEWEAMYYDNPDYADPEILHSNGYFGMGILHLPPPPNASSGWQAPIVVRGDFDGIVISKPESLFYEKNSTVKGKKKNGGLTTSSTNSSPFPLGNDAGAGQVLSLIQCDPSLDSILSAQALGRCPPPCCFIGYASGKVASVFASLSPKGDEYTFKVSEMHHVHESEVTDMTFVNCGNSPLENVPVLFSACCAGKVYFYPNALDANRHYSLKQSVLAFSNIQDCPIFSMVRCLTA